MNNFGKKLTVTVLSLQTLAMSLSFSGTPAVLGVQNALATTVLTQSAPARKRWVKRVQHQPTRAQRRAARKRKAKINAALAKLSPEARCARTIRIALRITHEPHSWLYPLEWLAFRESTYNPNAVSYGGSDEGLFQMLPTTFQAHALPGRMNIWNPVDNTVSAIRYIASRYGSPWGIPGLESSSYAGY